MSAPVWPLALVYGCLAIACVAGVLGRRNRWHLPELLGALAMAMLLLFALAALTGPPANDAAAGAVTATLPLGVPWIALRLGVDALSAWALLIIALAGLSASISVVAGPSAHEPRPQRALLPLFLGAMVLVVIAADAFTLLFGWELMSIASWAIIMVTGRTDDAQSGSDPRSEAALVYAVMAAFGTLCLIVAFGVLAGAGAAYSFDEIRAATPGPAAATVVAALVLVGAGSKAGLVPLHIWLPLAHPAAPAHVSGLMSGAMTKVALYVVIRVLFDLSGQGAAAAPWWLGPLLMVLGAATALLGVLHALFEDDLKRLLAQSTIENIGVIVLMLGLALAFASGGNAGMAGVALTAALFHGVNHSLFKSLLFQVAGAVDHGGAGRSLAQMGGLAGLMPVTAGLALLGCLAIAALPPLNGFASEWLGFQAILGAPALPGWGVRILAAVAGAALALTAALSAAAFVRAYGMAFLGRPRTSQDHLHDATRWERRAMLFCGLLCVGFGVLPGLGVALVSPVVAQLGAVPLAVAGFSAGFGLATGASAYAPLPLVLTVLAVAGLVGWAARRSGTPGLTDSPRRGPAWGCGFPDVGPVAQYSPSSFTQPLRRIFGGTVFAAREQVHMPAPGDTAPARLTLSQRDPVWTGLVRPLVRIVETLTDRLNPLQFLTVRSYLSLMFATLVGLLALVAVLQ